MHTRCPITLVRTAYLSYELERKKTLMRISQARLFSMSLIVVLLLSVTLFGTSGMVHAASGTTTQPSRV